MFTPAVHRVVEHHAAVRGDHAAVATAGGALTYGELNARANALARNLIATGLRRGSHIVVKMARSPELAIALLSVLKAGAAYTWFDCLEGCLEDASISGGPGGGRHLVPDLRRRLRDALPERPNLPILTRGTDIACVVPQRNGAPAVMVPHATITALQSHPLPDPAQWSIEPAALDLWLLLMSGATVTLSAPGVGSAVAA